MLRYPENTRLSLQAALEAGADYIEFDLQMNAGQEFIVIHDADFVRTSGVQQSVFSADMQRCQSISVHYPDRFQEAFKPAMVPTLAEIMQLNAGYPACTALVEIKRESLQHWGLEYVMDKLIQQLHPYREQCVLISFSAMAIEYAQLHSELKTGWLLEEYDQAHREQAVKIGADFVMINYQLIPEGEAPWPEFKCWMLYDIVDTCVARAYAEMGVALIETPDIRGMRKYFSGEPK